jgi:phospholipid/cholesterol/gamma-HCH transport system substrate-binding protein
MTSYRKNIAVGATMLGALALLGLMILIFGEAPVRLFKPAQLQIKFIADSGEGLTNGSPILYLGVNIGQIKSVELPTSEPGVVIWGQVEAKRPVPGNVDGIIRSSLIGGNTTLTLEPIGGIPKGQLKDKDVIHAHLGGSNVLPHEFAELAKELTELSKRLQTTVAAFNDAKVVDKITAALESVEKTSDKFGATSDELRKLIGDKDIRGNLQTTLANFKDVSENAKVITKNLEKFSSDLQKTNADAALVITRTGGHVDDLSKQLGERLEQLAGALEKFQSVANKIDKGEGTVGKLVNDPKLYEALLETSQELNLTVKDLRRLVEQWEQEGVSLKLGGKK